MYHGKEPPDTVVVTKLSDDGQTKLEYIYHLQKNEQGGHSPPSGSRSFQNRWASFRQTINFTNRKPIIIIKFFIALFLPLGLLHFFPSPLFSISLFNITIITIGAAIFACIPFSVLLHYIAINNAENRQRRWERRRYRHWW